MSSVPCGWESVLQNQGGHNPAPPRCPPVQAQLQQNLTHQLFTWPFQEKKKKSPVIMTLFCFCLMLLEEPKFLIPECISVSLRKDERWRDDLVTSFAYESLHNLTIFFIDPSGPDPSGPDPGEVCTLESPDCHAVCSHSPQPCLQIQR